MPLPRIHRPGRCRPQLGSGIRTKVTVLDSGALNPGVSVQTVEGRGKCSVVQAQVGENSEKDELGTGSEEDGGGSGSEDDAEESGLEDVTGAGGASEDEGEIEADSADVAGEVSAGSEEAVELIGGAPDTVEEAEGD